MRVTVIDPDSGATESLPVEPSTSVGDLLQLSSSLLNVDPSSSVLLLNQRPMNPTDTVGGAGVGENDLLLVVRSAPSMNNASTAPPTTLSSAPSTNNVPAAAPATTGLDFSSIFNRDDEREVGRASGRHNGGLGLAGGGLNLIPAAALARQNSSTVQWAGMSLDDVFQNNTNPAHIVEVIRSQPNVWKELNYHNSDLAAKLSPDADRDSAVETMRRHLLDSSQQTFMGNYELRRTEAEMEARLASNPYDLEANKYFGDKIAQANVDEQYKQMMTEYPETMGRILMLYIDAEVNGRPCVAFVDSGAQRCVSECMGRAGRLARNYAAIQG
jgi:hypothetical protein